MSGYPETDVDSQLRLVCTDHQWRYWPGSSFQQSYRVFVWNNSTSLTEKVDMLKLKQLPTISSRTFSLKTNEPKSPVNYKEVLLDSS